MAEFTITRNKKYIVNENYDYSPPGFRLKNMCYHLAVGDVLKFRGPNLGMAEFLTPDGRLVILPARVAYKILRPAGE